MMRGSSAAWWLRTMVSEEHREMMARKANGSAPSRARSAVGCGWLNTGHSAGNSYDWPSRVTTGQSYCCDVEEVMITMA